MVFRYQLSGGSGTTLQVWREAIHESKPLWIVREDQGDEWKEGRIRLRSYDTEYQIVFEGNIGEGHSGEIAIDDVRMGTDSSLENCMAVQQSSEIQPVKLSPLLLLSYAGKKLYRMNALLQDSS
uniref:NAP1- protein 2 n=1 Tax=Sphaerodactylus townsendi TaxID=933632 RepID=A0ACB8G0Q2_9SAUR